MVDGVNGLVGGQNGLVGRQNGLVGGQNGLVGGALGKTALERGHLRIAVAVAADIAAREDFIPDAGGGITAVGVVQMVSVAAKGVAETR